MKGKFYSPPLDYWEKIHPPVYDVGLAVVRLGLIGGVVFVVGLTIYVLGGQAKNQAYLASIFFGGIAPMLAALLLFVARDRHRLLAKLEVAPRLVLALVLIGVLVLGGLEHAIGRSFSTSWPFLFVVFGSTLVTAVACLPRRRPLRLSHLGDPVRRTAILNRLDALLIALLAAFTIFFSRFYPAGYPGVPLASDLVIYAWETPRFTAWLGFGLVFTCAALLLSRFEGEAWSRHRRLIDGVSLLGVTLFVLSLFDDGLYIDLNHYLVHVGPAMHALHGGIAMVDTYSIYGLLPWIVVKLAFGLLDPTFGTAALAVRISALATLFTMVLVLYAVSRRRLAALSLMVPMVLVAITFHPWLYTLNALPSTSGLRYLVPSAMVLILTAVRSPAWSRRLGVAVLIVASLWSLETFVYTLTPWGYVLLLQAVRERSIRNAGLILLIGLCGVALAHATFALATFLETGKIIDYWPYFGQFLRFRPDRASGLWQVAFDPNFAIWIPVLFGHFLVLSAATYRALQGDAPTDMASRLAPVAAYGFIGLNYFMGVPTWPSLGLAFLPVAIELICALEALSARPRRHRTIGSALLLALVAVSSVMVAFGTERFVRPMEAYQGNSSVLRRCFTADGCDFAEIARRLKRTIAAAPLDAESPASAHLHQTNPRFAPPQVRIDDAIGLQRIAEAADMLRRWAPNQSRVALLVNKEPGNWYVSLVVLMQTGQWYRWPISSPQNDEISEPLVELILRRVAEDPMQEGEILVVSNDRNGLLSLERKILEVVSAHCRLALVETRKFHSAFRIESCDSVPAPQVRLPDGKWR